MASRGGESSGVTRTGATSTVIWMFDAGKIWLPEISDTAPAETDRVGDTPAVIRWAASRMAVMVTPERLEAASSRDTLPPVPVTRTPE